VAVSIATCQAPASVLELLFPGAPAHNGLIVSMDSPSPLSQTSAPERCDSPAQYISGEALPSSQVWVFHLNPQGIVQFGRCETNQMPAWGLSPDIEPAQASPSVMGEASSPPVLAKAKDSSSSTQVTFETLLGQWQGHSLAEVVSFSNQSPGFEQSLKALKTSSNPMQLQGTLITPQQTWESLWLLHPLRLPNGDLFQIVAMGCPCPVVPGSGPKCSHPVVPASLTGQPSVEPSTTAPNSCNQLQTYAPRLNQITRNIRWTLDLETIRRRTVDGLGKLFGVQRCLVCSYDMQAQTARVAAEYLGNPQFPSWLDVPLALEATPYLAQAARSSLATRARLNDGSEMTVLAVATRYQNQINGFVLLYDSQSRNWSEVELGLITDLADQVGTAITHARLFGESHALAEKLQQANASLMEKQQEFQEAQRQAEEARRQAEEASRLKSEFLANTSHELRTPLNGMIGFLRLVLDGMADDPDEQQEFIQEAHKSALHLLNLINDVLDIAKIEAGKMQIDMVPVNLKELLADLENFSRPQAEQKGLYFNILIPATRDEITLNGNYQRLLQVLLNLVGNAVKFTHEGGITISAEVKSQRVEYQGKTWPGTVKLSVADTGIGVSLEKQDRLFQTFSQVDGERTRQYGGTGLGLAISQKLVEAMGGVVQFISMGEGLGATVTFTALLYQEPVIIDKQPVYPSNN
jgi:signal transduction histidine kinase